MRMIDAAERVRRAEARRHDRRADLAATPASGWPSSPSSAATSCIFVCPDKVSEDKINVLRAYGAEVVVCPTAVAPEDPRSYYSVSDRLARETPGGWKPDQYANPNNPRSHYETTGPEIWEQTDGPDHPLRRRRRHRRHDQRHRPLPQGASGRRGADHRRRPGGLGLLRRHRPAVPGRGRRRGLLARRPTTATSADEIIAVSDARLVRDDPAAGPRGGPAGRRLVRHGRGRRAAGRRSGCGPDDVVVVLLPDGGRGYLSKIFNDDWMADYGFLRRGRRDDRRRRAARQGRRRRPTLVHAHPNETVRDAIDILREYGVSQMPVVRAEPPVTAARSSARSSSGRCSTRCSPARASLADALEPHMSAAAADHRLGRAGRRRGRRAGAAPTRCWCTSTASRPACSPGRTCSDLPRRADVGHASAG